MLCLFSLTLALVLPAEAEDFVLLRGHSPILIVSVHGGSQALLGAPIRQKQSSKDPRFSIKKDLVTQEIAELYHRCFQTSSPMSFQPSLLTSLVHRKYVDLNRPVLLSSEHPKARKFHRSFHEALSEEIERVQNEFGWVLLLDIHGQSTKSIDLVLGTRQGQSISPWSKTHLWSSQGLLRKLQDKGFSYAPSEPEEKFSFGGGYITRHYGQNKRVEAWQLEHGRTLRFDHPLNRKFVRLFVQEISQAMTTQRSSTGWFSP